MMELYLSTFQTERSRQFDVAWSGLLYFDGYLAGSDSAKHLLKLWQEKDPEHAMNLTKGRFVAIVRDSGSGACWIFTDKSGSFPIYYSLQQAIVGDSYRHVHVAARVESVSIENIVEFLLYGQYRWNALPAPSLCRMTGDIYLYSPEGITLEKRERVLKPGLDPHLSVAEQFERNMTHLSYALSNTPTSADLTAGVDSRLIFAFLKDSDGLREAAIAADLEHPDGRGATEITQITGTSMFHTIPKEHNFFADDQLLEDSIRDSDGMYAKVESIARKKTLQRDRSARGIRQVLDGTGGEFFKDYYWIQDFPFYAKRKPDIPRMIKLRVPKFAESQFPFTPTAKKAAEQAQKSYLAAAEALATDSNIETYDRIGLSWMISGSPVFATATVRDTNINAYSPYFEYDNFELGRKLKPGERALDSFHRRMIMRTAPEIGTVRTATGVDLSKGQASYLPQMLRSVAKRVISRMVRITTGKNLFALVSPGDANSVNRHLREMPLGDRAVEILVAAGILAPGTTPASLPLAVMGNVVVAASVIADQSGDPLVALPTTSRPHSLNELFGDGNENLISP